MCVSRAACRQTSFTLLFLPPYLPVPQPKHIISTRKNAKKDQPKKKILQCSHRHKIKRVVGPYVQSAEPHSSATSLLHGCHSIEPELIIATHLQSPHQRSQVSPNARRRAQCKGGGGAYQRINMDLLTLIC